ncbi:hypothetical protein [Marinobacterium stanieri]|uniref:hypothetical protein n=1 Tax=Marinobacterium stanieri TaxID=49186 RepID=UPI0011119AD9|nr:hypothetical protein [Marinobacterium stanieri]
MKVVCAIDNILKINDSSSIERINKYLILSDGQLNLEIGKEYCVYGVAFRDNSPWYYLCLDEDDESPTAYPAELFNIKKSNLSSCWILSLESSSILFEEWANDSFFYERLVEGDPEALGIFKSYKIIMDNE